MKRGWLVLFLLMAALGFIAAGCGDDNAFEPVADDGSVEACRYEVSTDLDTGHYEDVLEAECATAMDRAAAYVGLAGFDINNIVERIIDANGAEEDDSIDVYMDSLVGAVTIDSLGNLYSARGEYGSVGATDDDFDDAEFNNVVIVNTLISLSSLKGVLDPEGDGLLSAAECDINSNGTPDEADAMSCALLVAAGMNCVSVGAMSGEENYNVYFSGYTNSYIGYNIQIISSGGPSVAGCSSSYKKLLYADAVVATTSDTCTDVYGSGTWPCPFEDSSGQPLDVVAVFEDSLKSADSYLDTFITDGDSEISTAIDELLVDACGADEVCTSPDIATYVRQLD